MESVDKVGLLMEEGIHGLTAWRAYNRGTVVEHRIKEFRQLTVDRTAVDHLDGNALL